MRHPLRLRDDSIKCIGCNASVAPTVKGTYRCVDCGKSVVTPHAGGKI